MAAIGMFRSFKTLNSLSALRLFRQPLLNAADVKVTDLNYLSTRCLGSQAYCTSAGRQSLRTNRSFFFHSGSTLTTVKDIRLTTQLSCIHRQDMLCSSNSKSFLNKMYPSGEAPQQPVKKEPPKRKEKKSRKRPKWFPESFFTWKGGLFLIGAGGVWTSFCLLLMWGPPQRDADGNVIEDKYTRFSYLGYPLRAINEGKLFSQAIVEPSSTRLLPDPLKEPYYQPPYTLVIEHDGILISSTYSMERGWLHKKRPGLDNFLQQVGPPLFEVVIYTHKTGMTAFPITTSLDPAGYISYRLFRDATLYDQNDGSHIKDLDCLNRDVSKVIILETDHLRVKKHPHNALLLQKWRGDDSDDTLAVLAAFLRAIAASGVDDVRPVLEYYSQFDNPLEAFKERQIKLREEQQAAAQTQKGKSLAGGWGSKLTGRFT